MNTENKKNPYERNDNSDPVVAMLNPRPDITTFELAIVMQLTIRSLQLLLSGQSVYWQLYSAYPDDILRHFDFYNEKKDFLTPLKDWAVEKTLHNMEEIQKTFQKLHTPHLSVPEKK